MVTEVSDFNREVLDESRLRPVLVYFWAPWCGPCRMLGPVLEKLADETRDWTLVKVNTDENQAVAQRYRISSIPAVKLFIDGEVADEFVGALPEPAVRAWLANAVPSASRRRFEEAQALMVEGKSAQAQMALDELLAEEPDDADAQVLLAALTVLSDPQGAATLARESNVSDTQLLKVREAVLNLASLLTRPEEALAFSGPAAESYGGALASLRQGDLDAALTALIDVVRRDRKLDNDGARKAAIALFAILGEQDPVTRKYRRAFDLALF